MKLLEGRCYFYGSREKAKDLLRFNHVKALVTSHEPQDWQSALGFISDVCSLIYLLTYLLQVFVSTGILNSGNLIANYFCSG